MNLAAVHTARYFCALGAAHFPLTGQYYSKIAAAAAFIAYNKYRATPHPTSRASLGGQNSPSGIDYPEALRCHSGYTALEIKEVALELLSVAREVETVASIRSTSSCRDKLPIDVYLYYKKANVVGTCILPNYAAFFKEIEALQAEAELAAAAEAEATTPDQSSSASPEESGVKCTAAPAPAPEGDTPTATPPTATAVTSSEAATDQESPEKTEVSST